MKKVTKRLLVACVAALAVGACQDSVTIVEPAPPPPPPPPPEIDATVTIQGLRLLGAGGAADPTNIFTDINVALNVEEGDNTVTGIDLLFNGTPFTCQTINTNVAPAGEGLALSTAGSAADEVECFWDTNAFTGACGVDRLTPTYANGTHTLGARITLSDGTTRDAANAQTVTLNNGSFIAIEKFDDGDADGQGIVQVASSTTANGRLMWGGPNPLPDGTANTLQFAACPVSYNATQVGSVNMVATASGPDQPADLGSGPGVPQGEGFPFVVTLDPTDNFGVEDDGTSMGHRLDIVGNVFDEDGLNVTAEFQTAFGSYKDFWLDFTGPTIGAGSTIQIEGSNVMIGNYYSDETPGTFNLSATVADAGVGIGGSVGTVVYNINDCDGPTCGSAGNTVVAAMATQATDVGEADAADDADLLGVDTYEVDLISVADELSNAASAAQLANVVNDPAGPIGRDDGEPLITALLPDTDPADDPIFVLNDTGMNFDAADDTLSTGEAGSGVDVTGCNPCSAITATDQATAGYVVTGTGPGSITFLVDISAQADGQYTMTLAVPDVAVLTPNTANDDYTYILDTTAPVIKPFTDFESNATLSGGAAIFDLAGQIVDGDGVAGSGTGSTISAFSVGIWIDTNLTGDCGTTVPADITPLAEGTAPGEVDNQLRSVGDIDGGEADFTLNTTEDWSFDSAFTVQNPGAGTTVTYCTITTATDTTADRNGVANSNTASGYNRFTITWQ